MRKVIEYPVTTEGRDKGKVFQITEMPAAQGEKWALKAVIALMNAGANVPQDLAAKGLAGIASMGIEALVGGLPWEKVEPLLDEMWQCIRIIPDPLNREVVRNLVESDIEEIKTRLLLRKAVFSLHIDFFTDAAQSTTP